MKPKSTPTLPSGGLLSNVVSAGPKSQAAWPLRPASRQNGRS